MNQNKKTESRFSFKDFVKAHNTRRGVISIAISVLIIAAIVLLNVAIGGLTSRYSLYVDTTSNKAFRLQDVTAEYAASINKDVDFYVLTEETAFEDYGDYYVQANKLIHQLCESSEHISLHYINLTSHPTFINDYPEINWKASHLILVSCGKNYRIIDEDDMFDYEYDSSADSYIVTDQHIEQALITAVLTVTADYIPTVAVLSGQAEENAGPLTDRLTNNAYNIVTVDLSSGTIPDEAEFLLIYAPAVDIDEEMYTYLSDWLFNNGGYGHNIVYFPSDIDVASFPNINALLNDYGMSVEYGFVQEDDPNYYASRFNPSELCVRFNYANTTFTEKLKNPQIPVFLYFSMPVVINDSTLASPLLTSSETAFFLPAYANEEPEHDYRVFNGAAIGTKSNGSTDNTLSSHVIVIGSYLAINNNLMSYNAFNNAAYFVNIFNTLSKAENIGVVIEGKDLSSDTLGITNAATVNFLTVVVRYLIPAAMLIAGLIIWLIRRRR